MIRKMLDMRGDVLGFSASGKVTAADYESEIMPAVDAMFARQRKVRFLYHLGEEFKGFEAGAMWDDAKIGFKHLTGWERVAIVTDVEWIRAAVKVFRLMMPGQVRVFSNSDLEEAKRWISE